MMYEEKIGVDITLNFDPEGHVQDYIVYSFFV